jgi:hypothetical protein
MQNQQQTPHPHVDMIIAWAMGYEIQFRNHMQPEWQDISNPSWIEDTEYRIKPTPLKLKFRVALLKNDTHFFTATADDEQEATYLEQDRYFVQWLTDWASLQLESRN